jgi:hypothetical protein
MAVNQHLSQVPDAVEVRRELSRVLNSTSFRGSKRCQDFLQYVVTRVLEGDAESLKERTLATEVFGRDATVDMEGDSIVRVGAREVRKRLAQYYVNDGAHDSLRIDIPSGSYISVFHYHTEAPDTQAIAPPTLPKVEPPRELERAEKPPSRRRPGLWIGALAVIVALGALLSWRLLGRPTSDFDVFWQPAFRQKTPVALLLAHPIVYHPSTRAARFDEERNGKAVLPVQRPIDVPPDLLDGSDYVPVMDQYVGFGDTVATLRLATLFVQHGGSVRLRLASKVEFNDLAGSGSVLIGAFTNRWTAELTKNFRFRFAYEGGKPCISDSVTGRKWIVSTKTDNGRSTEDYILICRLPHSQAEAFMVIGAGLTVYGTEEAGRILSQPELLSRVLQKLPPNWPNSNLEVVLHVEVVGDAPALPELVDKHTW